MTNDQVKEIRRNSAIEGELRVMERIPNKDFAGTVSPHLLGGQILKDCIERIRSLLEES